MGALIDFGAFSDVANKFIDKISEAVGWIATHETPNRMAEKTFIENINASKLDPLDKAVLISNSKKIINEYKNQANIVNIALQNLKADANPAQVSNDFVALLMDKSRLVYEEEFQILWGNILAQECNLPGSVPKGLLHIMEHLDKETANTFIKFASISINYFDGKTVIYSPVIDDINDEFYEEIGCKYDDLIELQSIGLLQYSSVGGYVQTSTEENITVNYFDESYTFDEGVDSFIVGKAVYTKAGNALCKAISTDKIEGFFEEKVVKIIKSKFL